MFDRNSGNSAKILNLILFQVYIGRKNAQKTVLIDLINGYHDN